MQVYILRGIPGSGKSTLAEEHVNAVVCSADSFFTQPDGTYRFNPAFIGRAHQSCFKAFIDALYKRAPEIIVDNTNIQAWEIAPYYLAAESYGYSVKIVNVECSANLAVKRNIHSVPEHIIRRMAADKYTEKLPSHWHIESVDGV